jgi:predicted protein tyrosine phosphatase
MPFVENISMERVKKGYHILRGEDTVLIQIVDPAEIFPKPAQDFCEIHQFRFLDADSKNFPEFCIQEEQAEQIVQIVTHAHACGKNIVVHCHAGICRSGAVAEFAKIVGYEVSSDANERIPNVYVKNMLLRIWRGEVDYGKIFSNIE